MNKFKTFIKTWRILVFLMVALSYPIGLGLGSLVNQIKATNELINQAQQPRIIRTIPSSVIPVNKTQPQPSPVQTTQYSSPSQPARTISPETQAILDKTRQLQEANANITRIRQDMANMVYPVDPGFVEVPSPTISSGIPENWYLEYQCPRGTTYHPGAPIPGCF